jgi:hypothetical protein
MRREWLLTACMAALFLGGFTNGNPPRAAEPLEGRVPLQSTGSGATVILSGTLTRPSFKLKSVRVVGSRLASKSSDPDQFRATLLGARGKELETVKMWSPLLRFDWDEEGKRESARKLDGRSVEISVPASILLQEVVLSWTDGKQVARVNVRSQIQRFCKDTPLNPACRPTTGQ